MRIRIDRLWPTLAGLLISVNIYLVATLESSPRALDVGGLGLAVWLVVRLARGRLDGRLLAGAGVTALTPLIWLFFALLNGYTDTGILAARWLLAIPWALALALLVDDEDKQASFAWGLFLGGLVNTAVIVLQWLGLESYLQMVGLSSSGANYRTWVAYTVRIPGLHGHHNASSSVTSLLVPAGLYLYFRGRCRVSLLLVGLIGLLVALHLTSTRSPLLVAIVTVVLAAALARRFGRSLLIGFVVVAILTPLVIAYGPPGGWARWKNTEAVASNAVERSDSTLGAISLSVRHPLGLGVKTGQRHLSEETGIGATHNAFAQAALVFGLPFGLLLVWGFAVVVLRGARGIEHRYFLPGLIALHVAGLFMFEEHLNNPTFIVLTAWLVTCAFQPAVSSGKSPAGAPPRSPS